MAIPVEQPRSQNYVERKGWQYSLTADSSQMVMDCPFCDKAGHFYMALGGTRDGLFDCKVCGRSGNLYQLQTELGDRVDGVFSMQDYAASREKPAPLPDADRLHTALMQDEEALDYLVNARGFSMAVIEAQRLGLDVRDGAKWIVVPYFYKGNLIYTKSRTVPPAPRKFDNSHGRQTPLYNEACITPGMDELIFTEGEFDALTLMTHGFTNVCAVPGANMKKAAWIQKLDDAQPKKIYLVYDLDKIGRTAAHDMAVRIGLDRVFNVQLPEFQMPDGRRGNDVNDWFRAGHTREEFTALLQQARPFDVAGVTSIADALDELEREIEGRGTPAPTYTSPWPSLNARFGGMELGDLVGIIAEGKVGKTTMSMNWADWFALQYNEPAMLYCLEMKPRRLARKWLSYVTQTDDTPSKSQITSDTFHLGKEIIRNRPTDLLFGYTTGNKPDLVFNTIRQAVRRYGVRFLVFDNLQLLVRSVDYSAQETSILSKRFKELAMDLNIIILLIVQPNRVREGEIVAARNAMNSSAIEKDVDAMIALHRNRVARIKANDFTGFLDTDENFEPQLLVRCDLNRYAPGGVCTLWFEGKTSTVREFTEEEMLAQPQLVKGAAVPVEQPIEGV